MILKKSLARVMFLAVALTAFFVNSNVAEAKVYGYDFTEENFPAADYANRYADVKAAYGDDAALLYNHYKYYGVKEGRVVKVTKEVLDSQPVTAVGEAKKLALDILAPIVNDNMTDGEKVKAVEAWMQQKITYGISEDNSCYHITGPMKGAPTLEEGYAETFEFFMDACGVECIVTPDLKSNKVKVDGVWYEVNIPAGILY